MRSASGALQGVGGIAVSIATFGHETCMDIQYHMRVSTSCSLADVASTAPAGLLCSVLHLSLVHLTSSASCCVEVLAVRCPLG